MKNKKQKGYVLAFVMILMFAMTVLLLQTGNILLRRELYARNHFSEKFPQASTNMSLIYEEEVLNGWI